MQLSLGGEGHAQRKGVNRGDGHGSLPLFLAEATIRACETWLLKP